MHQVFARQARNVRAGPEDLLPLDDRYAFAFRAETPREKFAGGPAAEHDDVVVFYVCHFFYSVQSIPHAGERRLGSTGGRA